MAKKYGSLYEAYPKRKLVQKEKKKPMWRGRESTATVQYCVYSACAGALRISQAVTSL